MSLKLPQVYLVRHGETPWTITGQHTGRADIELTSQGELNAIRLKDRLKNIEFSQVFTSPLKRAKKTCDLAGFKSVSQIEPLLIEWNYGAYEGLTRAQIESNNPNWDLFADGCPDGESITEVANRADQLILNLKKNNDGYTLLFSHAHFLRVLAARWLSLEAIEARLFVLAPTSLSILGYEHNIDESVIKLWNEIDYLSN